MTRSAERAIQRVEAMPARGPQNSKSGNVPSSFESDARSSDGSVYTSGSFRPSAVYIGRGVTEKSAPEYILYQKKSFAVVKPGSRRLPASQIFSPPTRWFDCRQSQTCARSRKYQ